MWRSRRRPTRAGRPSGAGPGRILSRIFLRGARSQVEMGLVARCRPGTLVLCEGGCRTLGAALWALQCCLEHADQIRLSLWLPRATVLVPSTGEEAGCWRRPTTPRSSSGGSRRWISARPSWCAACGCPARRPGQAAPGGHDLLHDDPVAAGAGRPAGRAGRDPGGDGGHHRLLEAAVLPAGGRRGSRSGWSTPRTSSTCRAGPRPTGWTRCGCARSPSGRCCGPASCRHRRSAGCGT